MNIYGVCALVLWVTPFARYASAVETPVERTAAPKQQAYRLRGDVDLSTYLKIEEQQVQENTALDLGDVREDDAEETPFRLEDALLSDFDLNDIAQEEEARKKARKAAGVNDPAGATSPKGAGEPSTASVVEVMMALIRLLRNGAVREIIKSEPPCTGCKPEIEGDVDCSHITQTDLVVMKSFLTTMRRILTKNTKGLPPGAYVNVDTISRFINKLSSVEVNQKAVPRKYFVGVGGERYFDQEEEQGNTLSTNYLVLIIIMATIIPLVVIAIIFTQVRPAREYFKGIMRRFTQTDLEEEVV